MRPIINIFRAKTRSLLTMAGIAVGVFAVVVISTLGAVGTARINSALSTMGVDTLLVQSAEKSSAALTDSDICAVRAMDGVADVMPLMASISEANMIGRRLDCYIWGVDKSADRLISLRALHGRLINNADSASRLNVCVIDEKFALETYGRSNIVGKSIELFLGGRFHRFEVVGVAKSGLSDVQGMLSNILPSFMYIPITTMQQLCGRTTYDKLAVKLRGAPTDTDTAAAITETLDRVHDRADGFICANLLSQKQQLNDILSTVTTVLSLVAGISLVVSGISVMTTMMMSVNERTREIGIKKSIGAKKRDICAEFLAESVLLTLIGCAAGTAAGLALSAAGCAAVGVPFAVNAPALVASTAAALAVGAVFGAYPAIKAASLSPAEAIGG